MMTANERLGPGQPVRFVVPGTEPAVALVVENVHGDRITLRADPEHDAGRINEALREGAAGTLEYADRFGVYSADATVVHRDTSDEHEEIVIAVPDAGEPERRRLYVRLHAPLDATCLLLDPERNTFAILDATVVDVGGGGAALAMPAIAPTGATIVCSLALPTGPPVVTVTHVLPSDADPRDEPSRRHVRVQFTLIAESDRDRLLHVILDAAAHPRST
jgi:hypothetical protein